MVYYFHAVAEVGRALSASEPAYAHADAGGWAGPAPRRESAMSGPPRVVVCTPSGNFGNLTAGLIAKRAGLPVTRFVAATNVNDVVPEYLSTGRFVPRASVPTIANAMDVGNPSNFERMRWLYHDDVDAVRHDITGTRHTDDEVRRTIERVYRESGYLLDPHSAIAYLGLKQQRLSDGQIGIFLATAHPAKFSEVVEPIIGRRVETPPVLADALARRRHILRIDASLADVREALGV
jgi:threonine synthase